MIPLARALSDEGGEEEERRLFYVALTRARDQLYLSYPAVDYSRQGPLVLAPSRFIQEVSPAVTKGANRPFDHWKLFEN